MFGQGRPFLTTSSHEDREGRGEHRDPRYSTFNSRGGQSRSDRRARWTFGTAVRLVRIAAFQAAVVFCAVVLVANGNDNRSQLYSAEPSPLQDDAHLYDVQFVGGQTGWAVGDHGVVWKTTDGGESWRLLPSPVNCALRSVCFLTDRVGWIVGGRTEPYTRIGEGVILFTSDGGTRWRVLAGGESRESGVRSPESDVENRRGTTRTTSAPTSQRSSLHSGPLPRLHFVKFFGVKRGVIVGEPSSDHPTGVFVTNDGGKTWRDLAGPHSFGWRAADFLSPEAGILVGLRGGVSLVAGNQLQRPRFSQFGLRGLRSVRLDQSKNGWVVGDGGLVLKTDNGGVSLQAPPTPLPSELRDFVDFRAVDVQGQNVWISGEPGSVIWHSPDGGRSWTRTFTGHPLPIEDLEFSSETTGWAVGALGRILRTNDGGETWTAVRGGGRRVALLSVHSRPSRVPFPLLVKYSGDLGYRSLVLLPIRRDVGPSGARPDGLDVRLKDAVVTAGGSTGEIGWQLPISIPGLDRNSEKLVADWNRRTEGRLRDVFLGRLVARLRTWRPDVVVIDESPSDDAVTRLLNKAVLQAVELAGDSTRFIRQRELTGLESWRVKKVYRRLPEGSTGQTHVDRYQYLPRLGRSVFSAAERARGKLTAAGDQHGRQDAYRLVLDRTQNGDTQTTRYEFFLGIPLTPDSEARRPLKLFNEDDYESQLKVIRKQRNFFAYAERYLDDPRHAGQLIGQLKQITADMDDEQTVLQLVQLAEQYRNHTQWELAEATLIELVERYPEHPAAHEAMRWLFQWWTGAEPGWQRVQDVGVKTQRVASHPDSVLTRLNKLLQRVEEGDQRSRLDQGLGPELGPAETTEPSGRHTTRDGTDPRVATIQQRHERALRMASLIRQSAPVLYRSPEIQFPLAALLRQRGTPRLADRFYQNFEHDPGNDPWKQTAATELWLSNRLSTPPKTIAACRFTAQPPLLDAVLSDQCWQTAEEIHLRRAGDDDSEARSSALVFLCYSADYLYLAASVPRVPGTSDDRPVLAGRTHDADLAEFDRLSLFLDVDRDYATFYGFHVDRRGRTAESCWEDATWNPQWYVAADGDTSHWRIEAAIPLKELVPYPPAKRSLWAAGIVRTIPAVGLESWTQPAATRPRPETFGLLRFD